MKIAKEQVHVRVFGRVQGVFFRSFVQQHAAGKKVTGWVKNCSDGSVEVVMQGDEDALESLITDIQAGPSHAEVESVEVEWEEPEEAFVSFEIRY